jgi:hypothetical protein
MKKIITGLLLFFCSVSAFSYTILYAEQFYRLFHKQLYQYPENISGNIWYLEKALRADFANPLYALAEIQNKEEWKRYRNLFKMHVSLLLIDQYLAWAQKYNKREAYFYNYPWKEDNLESLEKAEKLFRYSLVYWEEAKKWSREAWSQQYINLEEIQYWEDQSYRIETGELDYELIINDHIDRLERVRSKFESMDDSTY